MQSSGLQNYPRNLERSSTFLGQFWRPLDCILSRIPRKKVESWPKMSMLLTKNRRIDVHYGYSDTFCRPSTDTVTERPCNNISYVNEAVIFIGDMWRCASGEFTCPVGYPKCISNTRLCDGNTNCLENSDERTCG